MKYLRHRRADAAAAHAIPQCMTKMPGSNFVFMYRWDIVENAVELRSRRAKEGLCETMHYASLHFTASRQRDKGEGDEIFDWSHLRSSSETLAQVSRCASRSTLYTAALIGAQRVGEPELRRRPESERRTESATFELTRRRRLSTRGSRSAQTEAPNWVLSAECRVLSSECSEQSMSGCGSDSQGESERAKARARGKLRRGTPAEMKGQRAQVMNAEMGRVVRARPALALTDNKRGLSLTLVDTDHCAGARKSHSRNYRVELFARKSPSGKHALQTHRNY